MNLIIAMFITIAGYIIGLGAVTVIDIHGYLGKNSNYWTRSTISAHKVTKPLIWIGTFLVSIGSTLYYFLTDINTFSYIHWVTLFVLILNGLFLSFYVSPKLLKQEKEGRSEQLLSKSLQNKITVSFIFSFTGWWGSLLLFIYHLLEFSKLI